MRKLTARLSPHSCATRCGMRWSVKIAIVFIIIAAAYAAWPFMGLYRLARAVEARNAAAVADLVDLRRLRGSLTSQVIRAHLKLTGKDTGLGALGQQLAVGLGTSLADPLIAEILNPEALLDLLDRGWPETIVSVPRPEGLRGLSQGALGSVWGLWLNAEYRGSHFDVSLPPDSAPDRQFKLHLALKAWKWKLEGIDLPEQLRMQLARDLERRLRASLSGEPSRG